jgi:hypothetical protein
MNPNTKNVPQESPHLFEVYEADEKRLREIQLAFTNFDWFYPKEKCKLLDLCKSPKLK